MQVIIIIKYLQRSHPLNKPLPVIFKSSINTKLENKTGYNDIKNELANLEYDINIMFVL